MTYKIEISICDWYNFHHIMSITQDIQKLNVLSTLKLSEKRFAIKAILGDKALSNEEKLCHVLDSFYDQSPKEGDKEIANQFQILFQKVFGQDAPSDIELRAVNDFAKQLETLNVLLEKTKEILGSDDTPAGQVTKLKILYI